MSIIRQVAVRLASPGRWYRSLLVYVKYVLIIPKVGVFWATRTMPPTGPSPIGAVYSAVIFGEPTVVLAFKGPLVHASRSV